MKSSPEEALIEAWRQALVENATVVKVDGGRYPVRLIPKRGLRQVDFVFDGNEIRGLEQKQMNDLLERISGSKQRLNKKSGQR